MPPPPENFFGGLFRPKSKTLPITRSTRSPPPRATPLPPSTEHHRYHHHYPHCHRAPPQPYHHHHHVTSTPSQPPPSPLRRHLHHVTTDSRVFVSVVNPPKQGAFGLSRNTTRVVVSVVWQQPPPHRAAFGWLFNNHRSRLVMIKARGCVWVRQPPPATQGVRLAVTATATGAFGGYKHPQGCVCFVVAPKWVHLVVRNSIGCVGFGSVTGMGAFGCSKQPRVRLVRGSAPQRGVLGYGSQRAAFGLSRHHK
ncbi:hypothetical protein Tco_0684526, partial [Tanacetum coccineum]